MENDHNALKQLKEDFRNLVYARFHTPPLICATLLEGLVYLHRQEGWDEDIRLLLHTFRLYCEGKGKLPFEDDKLIEIGRAACTFLRDGREGLLQSGAYPALIEELRTWVHSQDPFIDARDVRVLILKPEAEEEHITGIYQILVDRDPAARTYTLDIRHLKEDAAILDKMLAFPELHSLTAQLLDVEYHEGILLSQAVVLVPDFLVDVTSIADCFDPDEHYEPFRYVLKKLLPSKPSEHLLIGRVINYFLDELIKNPHQSYETLLKKSFRVSPLQWSLYDDDKVRELIQTLESHFDVLKKTILDELIPLTRREKEKISIEPTFYSNRFGIQGRLDVLIADAQLRKMKLIELKSGKIYRPNNLGLGTSHYVQSILYYQLLRSAHPELQSIMPFILYSSQAEKPLRPAHFSKELFYKSLTVRNQLVYWDFLLSIYDRVDLFERRLEELMKTAMGYVRDRIADFFSTLEGANPIDRAYYRTMVAFLAREHLIGKIGSISPNGASGLASLWLKDIDAKKQDYEMLHQLEWRSMNSTEIAQRLREECNVQLFVHDDDEHPLLLFELPTNEKGEPEDIANFRVGDIVVLYPTLEEEVSSGLMQHRVYKGTIAFYNSKYLVVRLRSRYIEEDDFQNALYWNVEHDYLDNQIIQQYHSLFRFLQSDRRFKQLYYGQRAPEQDEHPLEGDFTPIDGTLNPHQLQALQKMWRAKDYFLLWGPPGTGKTRYMLKNYVRHWYEHAPNERMLIMAYTNRAVDEICETLLEVDAGDSGQLPFIRLGSRIATGERFRPYLLLHHMQHLNSRKKIVHFLKQHRIYVGTVAAFLNHPELFELLRFDTLIVDEAAQLLEPSIVGMLMKVRKFILIGDHRQLPAVVTQPKEYTKITFDQLTELGFRDCATSAFERLYERCRSMGWQQGYDKLLHQGRMHSKIMQFVSAQFYEDNLQVLHHDEALRSPLLYPHPYTVNTPEDHPLLNHRLLFVPVRRNRHRNFRKYNREEAALTAKILHHVARLIGQPKQRPMIRIGIMCPFRAQIAEIQKSILIHLGRWNNFDLTIETVERYQGSQRDVIVFSLSVNHPQQLSNILDFDYAKAERFINRKLNVAITRARYQFILLGDDEIIREAGEPALNNYLSHAYHWHLSGDNAH